MPELDIYDASEPSAETLIEWANRAEAAARSVDGVSNSEGAEAGWGRAVVTVVATNGFAHTYSSSHFSLSAAVLAGTGTGMERDYDYSGAVYATDLMSPEAVGKGAGERAVKRLNPRKAATSKVPVVFDHIANLDASKGVNQPGFGALVDLTGIRSSAFMLLYGIVWVSLTWMYWTEVRHAEVMGRHSREFSLRG